MQLNEIADQQFAICESNGWHNKTVLECLMLIVTEVGEAAEECRGEVPTANFETELADIILRTADLAKQFGIDLDAVVAAKLELNTINGTRGKLK
jgi:NTP pyrophosphatase (non-canonical NTP hydrolase)